VLFASTNFPQHLDAALRRPGRFDVDLKFDFATHEQAMDIYKHFYSPTPHVFEEVDDSHPSSTSSETEKSRIDDEAEHFANVIKEADIKVSIATIQGFLLLYKREPEMVQEKVEEWTAGIRAEQFPVIEETIVVNEVDERELREDDVSGGKEKLRVAMIKFEPKEMKEKVKLKKKEGARRGVQSQETELA
jgi:SpoVK/Ycf46/Vps4 family AAA+-type ATPase